MHKDDYLFSGAPVAANPTGLFPEAIHPVLEKRMHTKIFSERQFLFWARLPAKSILLALSCLFLAFGGRAGALAPAEPPSLFDAARMDEPLTFCGEKVELDQTDARERMEKAMLLTLWDRPQVVLWIKRSNRYFPVIEEKLEANGMPADLKYIALIESALRPHAGSSKGAIGFWQFTRSTGKKYGLQIDSEKDERRNIFQSTEAAIAYLKELHEIFGSWTLTAAAYNMGEHGLQAEIMVQKNKDFYALYLPLETQLYVFRIIAAKLIMANPQQYGFHFSENDLYPPLKFEEIEIDCFDKTPIAVVAEAAGTSFKVIKDLNPELRGYYLFAGKHLVNMPRGSGKGLYARLESLLKKWDEEQRNRVYVVEQGDNLSRIAERFDIPLPVLMIWNQLDYTQNIHPGDRLMIPANENDLEKEER